MSRLIKKYPNRRLYDTKSSAYISNDDVRAYLCAGEEIQIINAKNGVDVTRNVLFAILSERDTETSNPLLSQFILAQLVAYQNPLLSGTLGQFLEKSLQLFLRHEALFQMQMHDFDGQSPHETINHLMQKQEEYLKALQNQN